MKNISWVGNTITTPPIAKNKKITGTHFPTVLGVNPFATPFSVWCRCTRVYEEPFEGNKYTNAGQIVEPKVFDFLRESLGYGDRVITPEMVYGENPFKKTYGDFFRDTKIFGGMWDALIVDEVGAVDYVVEIKTVQIDGRSGNLDERWKKGKAPDYQALQASLYAHLLGTDNVMMVAVALSDGNGDYAHPEQVIPSFANGNVHIDEFKISERYPNFKLLLEKAERWWETYVLTGNSPEFDEKKDANILKELRTERVEPDEDITAIVTEHERLKSEYDKAIALLTDTKKRIDELSEEIKAYATKQFKDGDTRVSVKGTTYEYVLTRSESSEINKKALEDDGLLDKYLTTKTGYRLTTTTIKEDKNNG